MTCESVDGHHHVNALRAWLANRLPPDAYPPHGKPVTEPFHGTAFFTAGTGLIMEDRTAPQPPAWPTPNKAVMFIGNNVDSVTNFEKRRGADAPHGGPDRVMDTWKGIYQLLSLAQVDTAQCFFTNCYVGLVDGNAVGRHPDADDPAFRQVCWEFLQLQFELLQPAAVAVLGEHARDFLAGHLPELRPWREKPVSSFTPTSPDAAIPAQLHDGQRPVFSLLVHPSNYVAKAHFMQKWRGSPDASVDAAILARAIDVAKSRRGHDNL